MKYLIILFMIFVCSNSALADCYLCTEEKGTGFVYQKSTKAWVQVNLSGNQFLLKPLKDSDKTGKDEYGVYDAKKGTLLFPCGFWFSEVGFAHCGNDNDCYFKFVRGDGGTGKFVFVEVGLSYLLESNPFFDDGRSIPRVGIGSCIKVD